ncbi:MAG TPA: class I SAM-dependent methyltransferase [Vicinamibacterales bacterium]|nr:class I SAM-dependent methyltransferase [Vicinamibacterales bacterium]
MGSAGKEVLGHYAAKQIYCKNRLIAWSHRSRFEKGLELATMFRGRRLLDYGCGDGTFLAMLCETADRPAAAVGAEIDDAQVDDCRARLGGLPGVTFERIDRLDGDGHRAAYDGVVCMEVLEHVVDLDAVVDRIHSVLAADGMLIVSVPVETGLPLLVKQTARRVAGWRGIGDYSWTSAYTLREYVDGVFAGRAQHMTRPVYNVDGPGHPFHDHKGFNWKALRDRLSHRFAVERVMASPFPLLGCQFATQVWFVARKKTV